MEKTRQAPDSWAISGMAATHPTTQARDNERISTTIIVTITLRLPRKSNG